LLPHVPQPPIGGVAVPLRVGSATLGHPLPICSSLIDDNDNSDAISQVERLMDQGLKVDAIEV